MLGIRYPMEVNLVGDAAETLRALIPLLERKEDRAWREQIEDEVARWWRDPRRARACRTRDPINPQRVFHELSPRLPDNAHPDRRLGLGHELVGAAPAAARRDDGGALGHAGDDVPGACRTRWRPSSPTPTAR